MNLGHPPLTFLNRKLILWGFLLFGQEIPQNSAVNPAIGPEGVLAPVGAEEESAVGLPEGVLGAGDLAGALDSVGAADWA